MVIVGGDRGDLSVRHRDLRVERGEFQMLLMFLRAIVAAREGEDQRIIALEFAEFTQCARVIGQFVVGEDTSGRDIRAHGWTPLLVTGPPERLSLRQLGPSLLRNHICGVPVGPVRVALPGTLFVLPVSGLCSPERAREVTRGAE